MQKIFKLSTISIALGVVLLTGCASDRELRTPDVAEAIRTQIQPAKVIQDEPAVAPKAKVEIPKVEEPRLDLLVNNASARDVFMAIVADTNYSLMMSPEVTGNVSATLRAVTVKEAMESLRDMYGFDIKMNGRRITIQPASIQTRLFTINYPHSRRVGVSDLRVSSSGASAVGATTASNNSSSNHSGSREEQDGSRVSTSTKTDLWSELEASVKGMLTGAAGANVVASPQSGVLAVTAMPDRLAQVAQYLKMAQLSVERQVMLEAKIVEVELRDGYQSGIDWSALKSRGGKVAALGSMSGNAVSNPLISGVQGGLPGFTATSTGMIVDGVALPEAGTGLFGLAFAVDGFQAVLGFLETRGDLQVLSSPRIATMNNQKAVLKVGTDEYFVTGVSGGTTSSSTTTNPTTTMPTIELAPFFSGISLDVTPQIDDSTSVVLHVHSSVTDVTEKTKAVDLGAIGNYRFPMASSRVNESDTLVRIQDGYIVAIGGLMQVESNKSSSGFPGVTDMPLASTLLSNKSKSGRKKEVVVLIKPTIIRSASDWEDQTNQAREALAAIDTDRIRMVRLDGNSKEAEAIAPTLVLESSISPGKAKK